MRIGVASDHAGFPLKSVVIETVKNAGHEVIDYGTDSAEKRVDFPDFAEKAARALQEKSIDRAILICGSGVGVCISANKFKGVYAAICHDIYSAHQGVEHDNMNALCLGGRIIGPEPAAEIVKAYLAANFIEDPRFINRVQKIKNFEKQEK
ncbi:MAG: ribose 5-phosphate isomerase B [Anaerolineae bacterium]|nr:ribose 5-phosphate isomerase B [Anaerolineae bacterium]